MTWKWGKTSMDRLVTCDKRLQDLADMMLARSTFDLTILQGYRTKDEQEEAYKSGKSNARFGESKHNVFPSKAIDIIPVKVNWDASDWKWAYLCALAYDCANDLGIKIKCGFFFRSIKDCPHIQLSE